MSLPGELVLDRFLCGRKRGNRLFDGLDRSTNLGFKLIWGLRDITSSNQLGRRIELLEMLTECLIVTLRTSLGAESTSREQGLPNNDGHLIKKLLESAAANAENTFFILSFPPVRV